MRYESNPTETTTMPNVLEFIQRCVQRAGPRSLRLTTNRHQGNGRRVRPELNFTTQKGREGEEEEEQKEKERERENDERSSRSIRVVNEWPGEQARACRTKRSNSAFIV